MRLNKNMLPNINSVATATAILILFQIIQCQKAFRRHFRGIQTKGTVKPNIKCARSTKAPPLNQRILVDLS